eukprot:XP_016662549.1 PREDICTED: uncharacterized protein LOC107884598 [Acyrthosiphon pisum]
MNESLGLDIKVLTKNLKGINLLLKQTHKTRTKQIKFFSLNKSQTIENQAKKYLSTIFFTNQLNLIMQIKKRVHWKRAEISKAFTQLSHKYFSKRACVYVKNELHYPLPGLSSLQRWAKSIEMRNGILHDVGECGAVRGP